MDSKGRGLAKLAARYSQAPAGQRGQILRGEFVDAAEDPWSTWAEPVACQNFVDVMLALHRSLGRQVVGCWFRVSASRERHEVQQQWSG